MMSEDRNEQAEEEMIVCDVCDGIGYDEETDWECPFCGGSGEMPKSKQRTVTTS